MLRVRGGTAVAKHQEFSSGFHRLDDNVRGALNITAVLSKKAVFYLKTFSDD